MTKKLFLMLFLLVLAESVSAAIIHGSVYDISLDKVVDVKLEIDTIPKQTYVSKDGDYEFAVPVGTYTIKAGSVEAFASEEITVQDDGMFVLDLILFPSLDEETQLIDETDEINVELNGESNTVAYVIAGILVLVVLVALVYLIKRKKPKRKEEKKEGTNGLDKIIKILKQEGGRATQKEIRKHFPLSEAKMSLMIAELEHKGVIKKIKKGRGNIIILEK